MTCQKFERLLTRGQHLECLEQIGWHPLVFQAKISDADSPTLREVLNLPANECKLWWKAMYDELDQLLDKGTYEIVDCSKAIAQNKQVEPTYRFAILFFHQWNWWFGYDLIVINYVIVTSGGVLLTFLTRVIKDGRKLPKWKPRWHTGQFLGFSDQHSSTIGLICNLTTNYISSQNHVAFDKFFFNSLFETLITNNGCGSMGQSVSLHMQ